MLREKLGDVLMVAEGVAGPKLRARIKNVKGQLAKGTLSDADMKAILKDMREEAPKWDAPPEVKAKVAEVVHPEGSTRSPARAGIDMARNEPLKAKIVGTAETPRPDPKEQNDLGLAGESGASQRRGRRMSQVAALR